LAVLAETGEFQQVAVNGKVRLAYQLALQFAQVTTGEVDNLTAAGTYQVMMMPGRSFSQVASSVAAGMYLTGYAQFGKYIKDTVNSRQPNWLFATQLFLDIRGREMFFAPQHYLNHRPPLRSDFVVVSPENF